MKLPLYAELGHVYRTSPCREYPGKWIVFVNGKEAGQFVDDPDSNESARILADNLAQKEKSNDPYSKVSVGWEANDDDPRIGQVWFTGFYSDPV